MLKQKSLFYRYLVKCHFLYALFRESKPFSTSIHFNCCTSFKSSGCHEKGANDAKKQQIFHINSDASHEFDFKLAGSRFSLEYFCSYFCNYNIKKKKQQTTQHYMGRGLIPKKRKELAPGGRPPSWQRSGLVWRRPGFYSQLSQCLAHPPWASYFASRCFYWYFNQEQ